MEDDESITVSFAVDNVVTDHNSLSDPSSVLDPLMIHEGAAENVVLTSMVGAEDEDDNDKSAQAEMPSFGLIHFNGDGMIGSETMTTVRADQMGTESFVKEEIICNTAEEGQQVVGESMSIGEETVPQQFIILARTDGGMGVESSTVVAQRYIQVEASDGQTYFLAVADEGNSEVITSEPAKPFVSEQIVSTKQVIKNKKKPSVTSSLQQHASTTIPMSSSSSTASRGGKVTGTDNINQAWFTTRDDKNALHKEGYEWKQGQWTKEEIDILKANIDNYCKDHSIKEATEVIFEMSKDERKDFYRTIAIGIQRPLFSVYRRVTRMYDRKNHRGKYTPAEINSLRGLRAQHGNDWAAIGQAMGRSASSVKDKCRLMKDNCNSGKWYPDEENRLAAAVYKLTGIKPSESVTTGLSWASVADHVGSRSEKQCRTKWLNYLNWKQQGGADWTRDDDALLIDKVSQLNVNNDSEIDWISLAKDWSSVRSPQWLRGKWWALKRHVTDYNKMSYSDLIVCMRKMLSWTMKAKNGYRPVKPEGKDKQINTDATGGFLKNCIPLHITDTEGNGLSLSYCPPEEESYQYEVLQQWSPQVITQVTQNTTAIEGTTQVASATTTGHIIVQTIAGLSDGISATGPQSVIISTNSLTANSNKGTVTQPMTLHIPEGHAQTDQEMGVLTDSDHLHDATGIAMSFDPSVGQEITAVSEYSSQCEEGSDEHLISHNVFEAVTSQSGTDLVLGVSNSPSHTNSLMTSLKDPILMSSSSDADCEKSQNTLSDEHTQMIG